MNGNDVIEYVMNTPGNTNRSVLTPMVEAIVGSKVIPNPELAGTESALTGLQVDDTKYKVNQPIIIIEARYDYNTDTYSVLTPTSDIFAACENNELLVMHLGEYYVPVTHYYFIMGGYEIYFQSPSTVDSYSSSVSSTTYLMYVTTSTADLSAMTNTTSPNVEVFQYKQAYDSGNNEYLTPADGQSFTFQDIVNALNNGKTVVAMIYYPGTMAQTYNLSFYNVSWNNAIFEFINISENFGADVKIASSGYVSLDKSDLYITKKVLAPQCPTTTTDVTYTLKATVNQYNSVSYNWVQDP